MPDALATLEATPADERQQVGWPPKVDLFGVGVSVTNYDAATAAILHTAGQGTPGVVTCHAAHAIFRWLLDQAEAVEDLDAIRLQQGNVAASATWF